MMTQSVQSVTVGDTGSGIGCTFDLDLYVTIYTMPSYVFPKHHALSLNAKVNARSAIKKSTIYLVWVGFGFGYHIIWQT